MTADMDAAKAMVLRIMQAFPRQRDRANVARGYAEDAGLPFEAVYRLMIDIECSCLAARPWP